MMKKVIALALVAVMALVMLAACGGNEGGGNNSGANTGDTVSSSDENNAHPVVGRWEYGGVVYEFKANGEQTISIGGTAIPGTYKIDGDKITISYALGNEAEELSYTYSMEDGNLILKDPTDPSGSLSLTLRPIGNEVPAPEESTAEPEYSEPEVAVDPIIGTWANDSGTSVYEFRSDGTLTVSAYGTGADGRYSIEDDTLTYTISIASVSAGDSFKYVIDGDTMTFIKGEQTAILHRVIRENVTIDERLVGKWGTGSSTLEFKSDGSFKVGVNGMMNVNGTYSASGDTLVIAASLSGVSYAETGTFSIEGDTLHITGITIINGTYTRIE